MSKKFILSLFSLIICAVSVQAQLLWKVEGNGAKGTSYIFGTHHVAPLSLIDSIPDFNTALESVDIVIGELEQMNSINDTDVQQSMMNLMIAPPDSTLNIVLDAAQSDSLLAFMSEYAGMPIPLNSINMFKPGVVSMQIAMFQNMKLFPDFNMQQQLDANILQKASSLSKQVIGFESLEQQMNMLLGSSIKEQAQELMEEVRNKELSEEKAKKLANAYMERNIQELENILIDEEENASLNTLLYRRNAAWMKKILNLLPDYNIFVVVGAGHLVGEKGLIKELLKEGYKVSPVD